MPGAARDADGGLAIRVADTGIDIAADQLARVCEPFHQADAGLTRKHEGTGLGLSISRRLIEMHGGMLEIASAEGKGTTVHIRLPRELMDEAAADRIMPTAA